MNQACHLLVSHGFLVILLSILNLQLFFLYTCLFTVNHWILNKHGADASEAYDCLSDSNQSQPSPSDGPQTTARWNFFCVESGGIGPERSCNMAMSRVQHGGFFKEIQTLSLAWLVAFHMTLEVWVGSIYWWWLLANFLNITIVDMILQHTKYMTEPEKSLSCIKIVHMQLAKNP